MIEIMVRQGIPHCRELGMSVVEAAPARTVLRLPYQERLVGDPATGVLHGGAITTLVDTVCGMAVNLALGKMVAIATLDLRIDYLRPATPGQDLHAAAECYKLTRHVAFVRGTAYNAAPEDPVAHCVGTFMISSSDKPPLREDEIQRRLSLGGAA
jgi:uncharacterized protein (TIGR00369 family)